VIVLPRRELVAAALQAVGVNADPHAVPRAHYRAVRTLDGRPGYDYLLAFARALDVAKADLGDALAALRRLADRRVSGEILWSEPAPGADTTLRALHRARIPVLVVTNSDGHGEGNLRDAGICQVGRGPGPTVAAVIDSTRVGHAKPDPAIFAVALERVGLAAPDVVHVGDTLSTDVAGAQAAGIAAIHLDPTRRCRDPTHRHVRWLSGLWRHVSATSRED
jgi:putative hydrolase of the HAD superfamily